MAAVATAVAAPAAHAVGLQGVRVVTCDAAKGDLGGSVSYAARMRAVPGTVRMALRLRLRERLANGSFRPVYADGLGIWRKSRRGASEFRYSQTVRGLRSGAVYRAVVRYRWVDADGQVIRTTRERSRVCRQRGLPNLRVRRMDAGPGEVEGTSVYRVRVVNRGAAPARNVGVLLRVDGAVVDDAETIEVLQAGEAATVTFHGPVCRRRLRVIVDPKDKIAESNERDNVRGATCL